MMSEDPETPRMSEPAGKQSPGDDLPERKEAGPVPLIPPIRKDEDFEQETQTGTLPSGFTGTLEEKTEVSPEPDLNQVGSRFQGGLESIEAKPEPYPDVKRRSVTGQLGAFVTGILRGSPAEGRPRRAERKRPRPGVDEDVSDLRNNLEQKEADETRKPAETGELLRSFTGALKWAANPRNLTGLLFRRGVTGELKDTVKPIPPLERPKTGIEEDGLTGRLGEPVIVTPPVLSEPEDIVIGRGPGEPAVEVSLPEVPETPGPSEAGLAEDLSSRFEMAAGEEAEAAEQPFVSFVEAEQPEQAAELPEVPFVSFRADEVEPGAGEAAPVVPEVPEVRPELPGELGRGKGSGSLLKRVTGSLRRITGPLQEAGEGEQEPYPGEKRRSVTGQLGSIITGILRGGAGEGGAGRGERKPSPGEADGYVAELRQNLATEESSQPKPESRTGRLIQTITGSLRTGRLFRRGKAAEPEQPAAPPPLEAEIEQDILAGRLSSTPVAEPAAWVEPEDFVIELEPDETYAGSVETPVVSPETALPSEPSVEQEPDLRPEGVDSVTLLESGAVAALGQVEEKARQQESGQDWMEELRDETAEAEAPRELGPEREKRRPVTAQLRDFVLGFLRRPEETKPGTVELGETGPGVEEIGVGEAPGEVSDDLVSGRLDRSLGIAGEEVPQPESLPGLLTEEPVHPGAGEDTGQPYASFEDTAQPYVPFEETAEPYSPFEEAEQPYTSFRMDQAETGDSAQPLEPPIPFAPVEPYDRSGLTPEDEQLIWGEQIPGSIEEGRTIRAGDYWDQIQLSRDQDASTPVIPEEDAYAAAFLAGEAALPGETSTQEAPKYPAPEMPHGRGMQEPFEDIRSIVLEGQPVEERPQPPVSLAAPGEQETVEEPVLPGPEGLLAAAPVTNWKTRLAALPLMQKILIVEAIVVGIALVIAIPYFLSLLLRGPVEVTPTDFLAPRALPAGVPYPTGVTLPGGWYFKLNKSTFVEGKWKPGGAEWLEGTELRRVITLPWNPQTEAVVQSFQAGDVVELYLSNNSSIRYRVTVVERVPVDQVRVFTDVRPSLAIILYREGSDDRWVVISQR